MNIHWVLRSAILITICLILVSGNVMAIRPTSALYDKTGLTTTIDATCYGTLLVEHDMEWEQTNTGDGNIKNNTLVGEEARADLTYRENTLAVSGTSKYTKEYSMNGANVSDGRDNLGVRHTINYQADKSQNGLMLWDEQGTISAAGRASETLNGGKCVFANSADDGAAGFVGYVSAGSTMNVEEVAAATSLGSRAISGDSKVPVNLRYSFDAQGLDTDSKDKLATGSASINMDTSFEVYDKTTVNSNTTTKIQDYQKTQARGLFDLAQSVGYTSTY
ncbi:MAG TPA: hypothetical protein VN372_04205 [Methanospirillum sp.]|nr:hypothetical protein [Methanospirillum sp.]